MGFIRFLLACAVVLSHTSTIMGYSPVAGNLAVQCFYIISGFYMAMILTEKYNGPGANYQFYSNRALKIYPIYWLNLIVLIAWALIVYHLHYPGTLDFYIKYSNPGTFTLLYLFLANLLLIGLDWVFVLGINKDGNLFFCSNFNAVKPSVYNFAFNSVAWTIGLELMFYLIAPWLNKRTVYLLVILFLASLALRFGLAYIYYDAAPWSYMFFPTQVMFFVAGILSYRAYIKFVKEKGNKKLQYMLYGVLLFVVLSYYKILPDSYTYLKQTILFLSVACCLPFAFEATKKSKIDRFLGNLSYPIYISQVIVIKMVTINRFPKVIDKGFTALIMVIILALLVNKFVGEPIERYRTKRVQRFKHAEVTLAINQ